MNDVRVCIRVRTDCWVIISFFQEVPNLIDHETVIIYRMSLPSPTRKITHPNSYSYRFPQSTNPRSRIVTLRLMNVDIGELRFHLLGSSSLLSASMSAFSVFKGSRMSARVMERDI